MHFPNTWPYHILVIDNNISFFIVNYLCNILNTLLSVSVIMKLLPQTFLMFQTLIPVCKLSYIIITLHICAMGKAIGFGLSSHKPDYHIQASEHLSDLSSTKLLMSAKKLASLCFESFGKVH